MKFILKEPLTWGITRSYDNAEQAQGRPARGGIVRHRARDERVLRRSLDHGHAGRRRRLAGVDAKDCGADPRRAGGERSRSAATVAAATTGDRRLSPEDQQRLDKINALLDEQMRPYLQGDGGDLYVLGLEGNRLTVHYQGACGSCPSSISGTLAGIENLVKSIEPDIEVVAV